MTTELGQVPDDLLFARIDDEDARSELARRYDRLATGLAERFVRWRDQRDDLHQAARLALVKAIDRFDPDVGVVFTTFGTRTILGELKRYRRDRGWDVRVPRSLQERWLEVNEAMDRLAQRLGRSPTVREIAEDIGVGTADVLDAMDAGSALGVDSLDRPLGAHEDAAVVDTVGRRDRRLVIAGRIAELSEPIGELDDRDQEILFLRFFEGRTQSEIGERVGLSQMHVSRRLRAILTMLREHVA